MIYLICDVSTPPQLMMFLRDLLTEEVQIQECFVDNDAIEFQTTDFLVFAPGNWKAYAPKELLTRMMIHVTTGGRMLALGEAVWKVDSHELHLMYGARIRKALPYSQISLETKQDPLTTNFKVTEIWDTPLFFERSVFDTADNLVYLQYGKMHYPIVWRRDWFRGQVYCIASGSVLHALENYAPILLNLIGIALKGG